MEDNEVLKIMTPYLIEKYNNLILEKLSDYLNFYPDAITTAMIEETMNDTGLSEEETFKILLAGVLDIFENRDLMKFWLPEMVKKQEITEYTFDPYFKNIKFPRVLPSSLKKNGWSLEYKSYAPYEGFVWNDLLKKEDGRVIPQIGYFAEKYEYPCLLQNGREWMLITPNEIQTMKGPIDHAEGIVMTYGLGMGYFAYMVSEKVNVIKVIIIEKDPDVIRLFRKVLLNQFPHKEKIEILQEDALKIAEAMQDGKFPELDGKFPDLGGKFPDEVSIFGHAGVKPDYIFADIWHDPSDGLELYQKFKSLERNDIRYDYWIEKTMLCYME